MKMKSNLFLFTLLIIIITFTSSCKKTEPDTETQSAVDQSICDQELTRMAHTVNSFGINEQGVKNLTSNGIVFIGPDTIANPGWPRTFIIDYGTGVTDSIDHKIRKGQIICRFSDYWHTVGSSMRITLSNFYVNNMSVKVDSIKITRIAVDTFTNVVSNGICTAPGWRLLWSCDRTLIQTGGMSTPSDYNDDVFLLNGKSNGENRNGKTYTTTITTPIVKRASCSWIESGKIDLKPDGLATRTVDFGTGTCDDQASLTINGNTYTFTMN